MATPQQMVPSAATSADTKPPSLIPCYPGPGDPPFFSLANLKIMATAPVTATFLYLFCCMYINCVVQVYAEYRADQIKAETLPDIGFDILPDIDPWWADAMVYFALLATFARFFFGLTADNQRIRRHIFRRHIFCLGTLFLLRAFSIISTMLPNPLPSCKPVVTGSPWIEAFNILNGSVVTCADVMYSGHTVNISLCAMTWHSYSHIVPLTTFDPLFGKLGRVQNKLGDLERLTTVKLLVWIFTFLGYICIIGSRFHYTLDVFIGFLLTVGCFKYHLLLIRSCHLKDTWFNRLIIWSEADATDMMDYRKFLSQVNDMRAGSMQMV